MKRLENKTAIVTGGNSGIGKATAILFAKEGADLVLCARRKEALDEVAEECRKYGVQVVTVKADVSSHEDCSAVVKAAVDTFGKVDILVNNAGIVDKHRPITECTDEWWNEIIAIDQSSLFYMMKDTIPHMMASGKGSIINVSSIGGVFGNGGISYSAAKSAALAMTKNVAIQLAPNGIRCNAVCPGPTPTPLNTPEKVAEFSTWFAERCAQHLDMSLPDPVWRIRPMLYSVLCRGRIGCSDRSVPNCGPWNNIVIGCLNNENNWSCLESASKVGENFIILELETILDYKEAFLWIKMSIYIDVVEKVVESCRNVVGKEGRKVMGMIKDVL